MNVTVLGAGAWGTALAKLLADSGNRVTLWGHSPENLEAIRFAGRNERYLPGIPLPGSWILEPDIERAVGNAEFVIVAVPSKAFRDVAAHLGKFRGIAASVTKGIDCEQGITMSAILGAAAPGARVAALSGPNLALEVAQGMPTASVAASKDESAAEQLQALLHRPAFRVYTSTDILGVELGGALKNVIAIAAGTSDGLGFGDNSKAALITRGIAEMRRLGTAAGAAPETFAGLSGLGDLTVTCFSRLSRNRGLGERLGRGENLPEILGRTQTVAEGHPTARAAFRLARKLGVNTPIMDEVYAILYEGKNVARALRDLTGRDSKAED